MKVAIINTASKGTEVHAHDCADVAKSAKRNKDDAWVLDVDSKLDVSHTYWVDQISDSVEPDSAEGWATAEAWMTEFNFLPCTKGLEHGVSPYATDEDEATEEEAAPVVATAVTTWVGKQVAHILLTLPAAYPTISAKLADAKVTKAGDRTVKLTAEEAIELAALATELEAKGGSLAYSARTLRARLS